MILGTYIERESDTEEESVKVVKTAGEMIMMELRSKLDESKNYPVKEIIPDVKLILKYQSPLLKV